MSYYREIAERDPNLALAGLRIELEIMANNIADGFKITPPKYEPLSSLLSRLLAHGAVTQGQVELTRKILRLCNEAVHGRRVTKEDADEVINAASVLTHEYLSWLSWGFPDNWQPKGEATSPERNRSFIVAGRLAPPGRRISEQTRPISAVSVALDLLRT